MANINDKFGKASLSTDYAQATTVKTTRTPGESVLAAFDLSKFATDTPVYFLTYRKVIDPTTGEVSITNQTSWKALVNPDNNTLTNLTLAPGYIDTGNQVGDYIEPSPTSYWGNSLIEGLQTSHNDDGTLKDGIVTTAKLGDSQVTTAKLATGSVTSAKVDFTSLEEVRSNTGSGGSIATGSVLVSLTNYPFKKDRAYLLLAEVQQFTPNTTSDIWEGRIRVASTNMKAARVMGHSVQMPLSISHVYKSPSDGNRTVDIQTSRMTGTGNLTVEVPTITVVPLMAR